MMQHKVSARLSLSAILVIFLIGCGTPEPIKIGMVAGISGRRSQLGVSARNAIIMAVDQVNKDGGINGRHVELIVKDNKNDITECKKAVQELIDAGVIAVIGPVLSKMIKATLDTSKNKGVLVISPTVSTTALENVDDNFIRLMPVASREAEKMASIVIDDGPKKLAVIYDATNRAYSLPIFKTFSEKITQHGGLITYANDMTEKTDHLFTRMAQDIITSGAQGVFFIASGIDAAFLCQQIRKRNSDIRFYASHWVKSGNIIEQGGKSVEGMVLVTPFEREKKSQGYLAFSNAHEQMFKIKPNFVAKYAFETAQVLFEGIRSSNKITAGQIKNAILKKKHFEGLEEPFTINEFGDAIRSNTVLVIKDGRFMRRS